jgi:hypothetical protein
MPCLSVTNQEKHAFFILLAHHDDGFCHGLLRSYNKGAVVRKEKPPPIAR